MNRTTLLGVVAATVAGVLVAAQPACGGGASNDPGNLDGGNGGTLAGLVSLAIDPPTSTLTMAPGAPATETLHAKGSFQDGSTRDVTSAVDWSLGASPPSFASVAHGAFTTSAPGSFGVQASSGSIVATASIHVSLSGDVADPSFDPTKKGLFDGSPSSGATPTIAYPLAGALFPINLAPVDVQLTKGNAAQSLARVSFHVDGALDLNVYASCAAIGADGCSVLLNEEVCTILAGASESGALVAKVRLVAPDGSQLGEATMNDVAWTASRLGGGLYYWTTIPEGGGTTQTAIKRFDLDHVQTPPVTYYTQADSPPLPGGDAHPCMGCHAVSRDGSKIALTFGGSDPSQFQLLSVTGKVPIATKNTDPAGFATFTTFSPDASRIVNEFRGKLTLRTADASLSTVADGLFADTTGESESHPFWSPDGKSMAFVSWKPGENGASDSTNGDLVRGGQIWLAPSDGKGFSGTPTAVVPRASNVTSYYPAISDDGAFVVFNQSRCDGPVGHDGYGNDPCDGYDDVSARVLLVASSGGATIDLAKLDGDQTWTNSWPRWSPDHGNYRGKSIYWIAFSSKRPYGLRLQGSTTGDAKPQLWFAAVAVDAGKPLGADPSFAPVWLPLQNPDATNATGNHVPQWAVAAVPIK